MKFRTLILILSLLPLSVAAQVKFGYLSYRTICQEMPQYVNAQKELYKLKATYEQEAKRGEEEFQRKFADFLQGQKEFPANILQKRQAELQELMDNGIKFRKEAEKLLSDAEQSLLKNLSHQLDEAIVEVGMEMGYSFIINIDDNACPFINPILGDDVSNVVREKLGIPVIRVEEPAGEKQVPAENPDSPEPGDAENQDAETGTNNPMPMTDAQRPE